jgi:nucleoside-diphosphate-sugar epimerase
MSKVLMTGGTGCIGAATSFELLERGATELVIATRSCNPGLLKLWFGEQISDAVKLVTCDISDSEAVARLIADTQPTHIIHLGAFQSPDCDTYPVRGMDINVGGTMEMLTAAKSRGDALQRFVFASSGAVYGPRDAYSGPTVRETDPLLPPNLYGIWKVAGEHLARLFHGSTGVPTVCLRLNTTYGKGRDRGKTSAPTTALKSIALGKHSGKPVPFRMPYQGRENYHYVRDVGAHFAAVALQPFDGFGAFNIRGQTVEVAEFLQIAKDAAAALGMTDVTDIGIDEAAERAMFVCDLDDSSIQQAFADLPRATLEDGIRQTLIDFVEMAERGWLELPANLDTGEVGRTRF